MRQVVVRVKSKQEFDKGDGKGVQVKDVTEHVVIQKTTGEGTDDRWMIWGTVQPSTKEDIDNIFEAEKIQSGTEGWFDRIRNLIMMRGGSSGLGGGPML